MVREMADKFKELKSKSEVIVKDVTTTLQRKQQDFECKSIYIFFLQSLIFSLILDQDTFLEENKRLLNLRQKCRDIERGLKLSTNSGKDWTEQMCQVSGLAQAIQETFQGEDKLGLAVLELLPKLAVKRGVLTEIGLKDRFQKVDKVAHKLALLNDEGPYSGSMYVASFVRSLMTVQNKYCNPDLTSDFVPENLDNAELLYRAR